MSEENVVEGKGVLESKTFWANITMLIGAVAGYFQGTTDMGTSISAGVMALMNIVLRLVTKKPIS